MKNSKTVYALTLKSANKVYFIDEYTFPKSLDDARETFWRLFVTGDNYSIRELVNPYFSDDAIIDCARHIVRNVTANMVDHKRASYHYNDFVWNLYNCVRAGVQNADVDDMISEASIAVCKGMQEHESVWNIYRMGYSAVNTYVCRMGVQGGRANKLVFADDELMDVLANKFADYFTVECMNDIGELVKVVDRLMDDELSDLQKDAFIASVDGFGVREIARYREKAPSTIYKQLASARKKLAIRLLDEHADLLPLEIVWERDNIKTILTWKAKNANN